MSRSIFRYASACFQSCAHAYVFGGGGSLLWENRDLWLFSNRCRGILRETAQRVTAPVPAPTTSVTLLVVLQNMSALGSVNVNGCSVRGHQSKMSKTSVTVELKSFIYYFRDVVKGSFHREKMLTERKKFCEAKRILNQISPLSLWKFTFQFTSDEVNVKIKAMLPYFKII